MQWTWTGDTSQNWARLCPEAKDTALPLAVNNALGSRPNLISPVNITAVMWVLFVIFFFLFCGVCCNFKFIVKRNIFLFRVWVRIFRLSFFQKSRTHVDLENKLRMSLLDHHLIKKCPGYSHTDFFFLQTNIFFLTQKVKMAVNAMPRNQRLPK